MDQPREKSKILYIDDTPSARRLVQRLLFTRYAFFEAPDGLTGIDMAVEIKPDLVLVDLHLPHFTGYEVATRLKALMPGIPIVALTADVTEHVRERALASGCDGYIAKPIDADTFEGQVAEFLGGQREELVDDSFRQAYQQTLVARLEEKVRELTEALQSNAELSEQRAQLLKETQRRAVLLEAGSRVAQSITSILDLDELLGVTVDIIREEFGFRAVGVFLGDATGEWLVLRAGMGEAREALFRQERKVRVGGASLVGTATGQREAVVSRDLGAASPRIEEYGQSQACVEMALPLVVGKELIGALTVQSIEEGALTQEDVKALQTLADQLAIAIHNATLYAQNTRLLAQAERRARLLEAAAEVGRGVTSLLNSDALLNQTVDIICNAYGFYYAGVFLVDDTGEWAALRAGYGEAGKKMIAVGHKLEVGGQSMVGAATAGRRALIALDVGEAPMHFKNPHLPLTRSEMALPLVVGDKVIGAVTVQSVEEAAFSDEDIVTLQAMADQLAIAIDNARLLNDLEVAHTELVRTKTFEAIATATGEAIHWVGNKAAPIPGSVSRIIEDIVRYLILANALLADLPPERRDHTFAQMLRQAVEDIKAHGFGFNLLAIQEELEQLPLKRLQQMLSIESIFEDLDIIDKSARSILNIKEDLIGPAREKRMERVHLPELMRETVRSMGLPKEVTRLLCAEDVKPIEADPRQLGRVFINLIKNAMEAMDKVEDKKLFIWVRAADDPRYVAVDVTDNGEGIPQDKIDKIWVPFYTTKGDRGGTGLGLPACAKIISQMGGKISVDSVVGEGTTFSVFLPVAETTQE